MESAVLKRELRRSIRTRLDQMRDSDQKQHSERARQLLENQDAWKKAKKILFYAPLPGELDVWPLFEDAVDAGKEVYLPRFVPAAAGKPSMELTESKHVYVACAVRNLKTELKTGQFDIREPLDTCREIPLNRLDFVLVPGVAFDLQGRRLGRGKGYYDRLLAEVRGTTCGVAFDEQIVDQLPVEPHDIHVNCILTPTRWIEL